MKIGGRKDSKKKKPLLKNCGEGEGETRTEGNWGKDP